jgi:hypothetical protein
MTAEVGVMNRIAVALAADSAITLGGPSGKIYTSAEKLFLMAEKAPVGVMVYGGANLLGLPWETVIKVYRKQLAHRTFGTLEEYVGDFVSFLHTNTTLFPPKEQQEFVQSLAAAYYQLIPFLFQEEVDNELRDRDTLSDEDIERVFATVVEKALELVKQKELLDESLEDFPNLLVEEYGEEIESIRDKLFSSFPSTQTTAERLVEFVAEAISRQPSPGSDTGVVIAGFGENECFPSLVELNVRGIALNRALFSRERHLVVGKEAEAFVVPFAQREMVHAFMEGIDPVLKSMIEVSVDELFKGVSETILEEVKAQDCEFGPQLEESISETLDELLDKLKLQWDVERRSNYSDPVMNVVASLPKDELAAMAESLVNMTKFKRRVSEQQETVGGPIDVAVITKGDGFVWLKRKHYFRPELNPRFMSRYHERSE